MTEQKGADIIRRPWWKSLLERRYPVAYLLRILVVLCSLPIIIGFVTFILAKYYDGRQLLLEANAQRAQLVSQAIDDHLLRAQGLLRSFAGADEILAGDLGAFSKRAARASASAGLGSQVMVYRVQDGRIARYSPDDNAFVVDRSDTAAAQQVLEERVGVISNVIEDSSSGQPVVHAHVPVVSGSKVIYSIAIVIPTAQLTAVLLEHGLPAGWLASLIDRNGTIAGRSRKAETFVGQVADIKLREAVAKDKDGTLETLTRDGVKNLAAFARSPHSGYTTVIGVPLSQVTAPLKRELTYLTCIFILLLIAGLLLARRISKLIATSVHALIEPAVALGKGAPFTIARVHLSEANEVAHSIERAAGLLAERDAVLRAQQEELERFYFFSEHSNEMLLLLDVHGQIRYANRMASKRLGYTNAELLQLTIFDIDLRATPALLDAAFERCRSNQAVPFERYYRCKNGSGFPVEITATVLEHKAQWLMHVAPRDISERVQAEHAIRWAASHDPLTGLANRACAREALTQALSAENGSVDSGALLYIDLDRFKPVNDLYGHEIGDRVLVEVAHRMQSLLRPADLLARVGGDEFVALLPGASGDSGQLLATVQSLVESVCMPIRLGNIEVKLSASVGISRFPDDGTETDVVMHAADVAMLQAKQQGRNAFCIYSPDMDDKARLVINVERRLQKALETSGFLLAFQPIVNLRSGAVDGVEALVRLDDKVEPPLGPAIFIPVAEMCGLIALIGDWVLLEACRQQRQWRERGISLQVSVNVSALQFQRDGFTDRLRRLIATVGIDPQSLVIELTETAIMENLEEAALILREIRGMGVKISLDDFGTGYSSLSILSTLPIDKIKIDQSFVLRLENDHASRAVIDAVIAIANSLELELVAEGIETEASLRYLQGLGCQHGQGYYFSRPVAPAALEAWLDRRVAAGPWALPLAG